MLRREFTLAEGDAGTEQTIAVMRDLVQRGVAHPLVRRTAVEIARTVPPGDLNAIARAVRRWLQDHVHFVYDPMNIEHVTAPDILLNECTVRYFTTGDCDDIAVLGAALAGAVGVQSRFVVLGFGPEPDAPMGHVFTELFDGAQWLDLDITRNQPQVDMRRVTRMWHIPVWE